MSIQKPTAETLPKEPLARLLAVMAWLRVRQHGCPWDIDQTFRTIAPYTIEEAYEVADAIERDDMPALKEELGDGTFLIVYENAPKGQGDSEPRTVFDLVVQHPGNPKEGILLTLGVPASDAVRGLKLMALLKQNMRINW